MKTTLSLAALALVVLIGPTLCFGLMEIELVSPKRAKELGIVVKHGQTGPDALRVIVEFDAKGALKDYARVDLEISEGGKLLLSSTLKEDEAKAGHIVVSFYAARASLDKMLVRIITEPGAERVGHVLRLKDFEDLKKMD